MGRHSPVFYAAAIVVAVFALSLASVPERVLEAADVVSDAAIREPRLERPEARLGARSPARASRLPSAVQSGTPAGGSPSSTRLEARGRINIRGVGSFEFDILLHLDRRVRSGWPSASTRE
jgi:hypothetical protein